MTTVLHPPVPDAVVVGPGTARGPLTGTLRVPGDKSISHRAHLFGALADGPVTVVGAAPSGDVTATARAVMAMGARIVPIDAPPESPGAAGVRIEGTLAEAADVIDCGNAGTGMRLLTGLVAGLDGLTVLTGDGSLRRRPMDRVAVPLRQMGARVDGRGERVLAPLAVRGGGLAGIDYTLPVASAQVKSAVLIAGLRADGTTRVREPGPTRDHTERMLAWMEADAGWGEGTSWVRSGPLAPRPLHVPADPSSAAFWLVAAACLPGSRLTLREVCLNPTRTGALDVLRAMGAVIEGAADREWCGEPVGDLVVHGADRLGPGEVAGDLVVRGIDELPVLAVAGALGGGLVVREAEELRVKESDRIDGVVRVLAALGGRADPAPDGFTVQPGLDGPAIGSLDAHGDHRLAMAAAIGAVAAGRTVRIDGFATVASSYPTFLHDLEALGGRAEAVR